MPDFESAGACWVSAEELDSIKLRCASASRTGNFLQYIALQQLQYTGNWVALHLSWQLRCNRCKSTGLIRLKGLILSRAGRHAQGCQGRALPLEVGIRMTGEDVIQTTGPAPDTCRVSAAAGLQLLML